MPKKLDLSIWHPKLFISMLWFLTPLPNRHSCPWPLFWFLCEDCRRSLNGRRKEQASLMRSTSDEWLLFHHSCCDWPYSLYLYPIKHSCPWPVFWFLYEDCRRTLNGRRKVHASLTCSSSDKWLLFHHSCDLEFHIIRFSVYLQGSIIKLQLFQGIT